MTKHIFDLNTLPPVSAAINNINKCEVIRLKRGETGYWHYKTCATEAEAQALCDRINNDAGLTKWQVEAMHNGSMFGFDCKGADPAHLEEAGKYETITLRLPKATADFVKGLDEKSLIAVLSAPFEPGFAGLNLQAKPSRVYRPEKPEPTDDEVGEWVGQHYAKHFPSLDAETQDDYRQRYKAAHADTDDQSDEMNCRHEWNQTAGEADENGGRIYCLKCGADGDA